MSPITVRAENFRALARLEWSPEEVCLLAGANGVGKTTILDVFQLLRNLFLHGHENALASIGGTHVKRIGAPAEEPVVLELEVDDIRWTIRLPVSHGGLRGAYGEELYRGDEPILRAAMFSEEWFLGTERLEFDDVRCCAKVLWDRGSAGWMQPLVDALRNTRSYKSYWLDRVQNTGSSEIQSSFLHGTGKNLWSVLANWKGSSRRYHGQFEWVMEKIHEAFPGLLQTIEFDRGLPFLYGAGVEDPADGLPPSRAADGLLTGLLHLTAVAGAPSGSILMFDEVENQLHPHAIRVILDAMRSRAEERELVIILTSHSPVVMNAFRRDPDQFYVLEPRFHGQPKALDELHDADWLAQFSLGDLYDRLTFGAPGPAERDD